MKNKYNLLYPFKVWILTLLIGPVPVLILSASNNEFELKTTLFAYSIAFLYSLPTLGISYLTYLFLIDKPIKSSTVKFILIILGNVLFLSTLILMGADFSKIEEWEKLTLPVSYMLVFVAFSLMIKISKEPNAQLSRFEP